MLGFDVVILFFIEVSRGMFYFSVINVNVSYDVWRFFMIVFLDMEVEEFE